MEVKPFKNEPGSRKEQVRDMFNRIADRYDFLNHLLSFNIDKKWRLKVYRLIESDIKGSKGKGNTVRILDIATGTGDLAFTLSAIPDTRITGLDLSEEMIKIAKRKEKKRQSGIEFVVGDSENLPFPSGEFDYITVAFGVRNFEDLQAGLGEMNRALKQGGKVFILEFSHPTPGIFSLLYKFYSRRLLPLIASLFTNEPRAYTYLPESISAFPEGEGMLNELRRAGFINAGYKKLSSGISSIYYAESI
jgi:demethylmenaquinone methyltransferase/2-methoxy-6-polyprenyl-1,4-benzoquinol methylase